MIEAPLLLRLQDFESRHDAIFSYIFNVYVAAQKQFFFECSTAMAPFPPAVGAALAIGNTPSAKNASKQAAVTRFTFDFVLVFIFTLL